MWPETTVCLDLVQRYLWRSASERSVLLLCKLTSVFVCAVSIALVCVPVTLAKLTLLQSNLALQVAPLFYLGLDQQPL